MIYSAPLRRAHGWAWLGLTFALALHVLDEATHDFLALYNPIALRIRQTVPFLPVPVFTFRVWLAGLIAAVVLLLALSPFVFKGASWARAASYLFATFMLLNGCAHIFGSIYASRLLAGTYSAPLLVVASLLLIVAAWPPHHHAKSTGA